MYENYAVSVVENAEVIFVLTNFSHKVFPFNKVSLNGAINRNFEAEF